MKPFSYFKSNWARTGKTLEKYNPEKTHEVKITRRIMETDNLSQPPGLALLVCTTWIGDYNKVYNFDAKTGYVVKRSFGVWQLEAGGSKNAGQVGWGWGWGWVGKNQMGAPSWFPWICYWSEISLVLNPIIARSHQNFFPSDWDHTDNRSHRLLLIGITSQSFQNISSVNQPCYSLYTKFNGLDVDTKHHV